MGSGVRIELGSFLIRTAKHAKDYTGGRNQYCDLSDLQSMIDCLEVAKDMAAEQFSAMAQQKIPAFEMPTRNTAISKPLWCVRFPNMQKPLMQRRYPTQKDITTPLVLLNVTAIDCVSNFSTSRRR